VSHDQVQKSATLAALNVNAQPARWRGALAAAEQELRRALEHGVQPGELAREISEYRAALEAAAAGVATRDSRALANEAVAAVDNDWVFTDPKLELELFNAAVEGYGAEAATAAIRSSFAGQGPLVFLSAGSAPEGGAAGVLEAFNQSRAMPVKPPPAEKQVAFDYAFGTPGAITARRTVESLGVHMATFANGVKLTVKQTPFEQGRIRAAVRVEGGYRTLGPVKPGLNWALPFAVAEAGVGKLDREDLDRATTGRVVGLDIDLDDDAFTYQGATRPADLDLQLGVLAAHVVDPGWRGEGLARLQDFAQTQFQQLSSSPGRVFGRDGPALLRAGDARWQFPTLDQARALTMADVKAALAPGLARAPIEVILVGDVTPAAAEEAVARTFGALPARARQAPGLSRNVVFPKAAGETMRLAHAGRADQALAFVAFDAADLRVARLARAERFVSEMMQLRLTEEVREKLGASYSPNTVHAASRVFQDYGYVAASAEVEPAQIDPIFALIEVVAADLREGRFDDDLVARARAPLVEQVRTAEKSNSYWLGALERLHDDAGLAAAIETRAKDFETLTREELVAAARRVFAPGAPRLKAAVIPAQ
jgi:zinc protease